MQTGLYVFECGNVTKIMEQKHTINLYPNPTTNHFTVQNNKAQSIELFDIYGKLVLKKRLSKDRIVLRDNLANGVYFYQLRNKKEILENVIICWGSCIINNI